MDKLKVLPNITKLSERVWRILGQNPGKFTLQGTNVYLLGQRNPYVLLDTGEGRQEFIAVLESALRDAPRSSDKSSPLISDIVITHRHHDHYGGLPHVLTLLQKLWSESSGSPAPFQAPRLHKYPLPADEPDTALQSILESLPAGSYTPSPSGTTLHDLSESRPLSSPYITLEVIHTPGHTHDSICLLLAQERVLFTADTVLGQGTAVFEDLAAYIASLRKILARAQQPDPEYGHVYPGHGPVVEDGPALITMYIAHRMQREHEIVKVLQSPPPADGDGDGAWTLWEIVGVIYKAYPKNLWLPAAHGVNLHLKKLESEGRAQCLGGDGVAGRWKLASKL